MSLPVQELSLWHTAKLVVVQVLGIALQRHCGQSGILHLALHGSAKGLVERWQQDILSVVEPGETCSGEYSQASIEVKQHVLDAHWPS